MVKGKEARDIIIAMILMSIIIAFAGKAFNIMAVSEALAISTIIILIAVFSKKAIAKHFDISIDIKIWHFQRFWISSWAHLKKAAPIGLFIPLILSFLSGGIIKFFAFLQYDAEALPAKAVKKYGRHRFSGMLEWDDALIVFYSALPLLILAIASKIINIPFSLELSKFSLYYCISNLIPIGKLDGSRLFFGSIPLFIFTWVLVILTGLIVLL